LVVEYVPGRQGTGKAADPFTHCKQETTRQVVTIYGSVLARTRGIIKTKPDGPDL
jgi:hypothetical protein